VGRSSSLYSLDIYCRDIFLRFPGGLFLHHFIAPVTISLSKNGQYYLKEHVQVVYSTLKTRPSDIIFNGVDTVFCLCPKTPPHNITNFVTSDFNLQSTYPKINSTIRNSASNNPISVFICYPYLFLWVFY
jgi:hypothetical protein